MSTRPDKMALEVVVALLWAPGSQLWKGNWPDLAARPMVMRPKAAIMGKMYSPRPAYSRIFACRLGISRWPVQR